MSNFENELMDVMASRNFHIRGKINWNLTGKFQRFSDATKHMRKRDLFVVLHDYDRGATFGDWHYPEDWYTHWNSANGNPTLYEIEERRKAMEKLRIEQDYERGKREWRAQEFFHRFYLQIDARSHSYVIRKRILPYYAKLCRSWLVVPVHDIDHDLITVQIIKPDGFKRLWKGTSHKHHMIWLWEKLPDDYTGVIRICEGYATGCTIRYVTKSPVVCALSAQNMPLVAKQLRGKYPKALLKICADDDQWSRMNAGFEAAAKAKLFSGAVVYWPDFTGFDISEKPTDFNDLFCLAGKGEVRRQLILIRDKN